MAKRVNSLKKAFARQSHLGRYILHLKQRITDKRLNMIVGAGATKDAGAPLWNILVQRLRRKLKIPPKQRMDPLRPFGPAMVAEILEARMRRQIMNEPRFAKPPFNSKTRELYTRTKWASEIANAIHRHVPKEPRARAAKHPYLQSLARTVALCPLTVNFNFDDIIDRATQLVCEDEDWPPPHIVWKLPVGSPSLEPTILHINGYLPASGKSGSGRLVLTEGAFFQLMLQQNDYQSIALLRLFAESTVLIVGCSLEDSSLKAILTKSAQLNPGNYHYIIHHLDDVDSHIAPHFDEIFDANKAVYNLITLFMTSREIDAFLALLNERKTDEFELSLKEYDSSAVLKYHYYVVGAVGSGKTTLIRKLRMYKTYEEWGGPVPKAMYRDPDTLSGSERKAIDRFLKKQLRKKNDTMRDAPLGFHVMDRGYIDLIAFSKRDADNSSKIDMLRTHVAAGGGFQNGQIIFLHADERELEESQWARGQVPRTYRGQEYGRQTLKQQQSILEALYDVGKRYHARDPDVDADALARNVAFEILTGEYVPLSFSSRVDFAESGGVASLYAKVKRKKKRRVRSEK